MTPKTTSLGTEMKRVQTTREHLDYMGSGIPIDELPAVIDSYSSETTCLEEVHPLIEKKGGHDDTVNSEIVDYAISTGVSGVQYVIKTLSRVMSEFTEY